MHFDDRLATVLRLPANGGAFARIQYRQLIDILGRIPADSSSDALNEAYACLASLTARLPVDERARVLEEPSARIASPRLVSQLAQDEPRVATAAIRAARLDVETWLRLIPALPVRARGILRHRRDLDPKVVQLLDTLGVSDRGLPAADWDGLLDASPPIMPEIRAKAPEPVDSASGIGAIVRRIEEFRKAREARPRPLESTGPLEESPRLPLGDSAPTPLRPAAIDIATDSEGRISWADALAAPSLVGMRIGGGEDVGAAQPSTELIAAMRHRQPIEAALVTLAGAPLIAGEWRLDAVPLFDRGSGRFTGYAGRMRRPSRAEALTLARVPDEADRMRQVLHELRTPANAIQVAAEIIQQQLFGPAPHEYRALAAAIAADAAHILAGFEELDRLVKLECGAQAIDAGSCDFAEVLEQTLTRLAVWTGPRRSGFALTRPHGAISLPITRAEAERMAWRLLASLAGSTGPEEILPVNCELSRGFVLIRIALPRSLAELDDAGLFTGAGSAAIGDAASRPTLGMSSGMFGIGFTLRLAAAEVQAAGGRFQRDAKTLLLELPCLTLAATNHSDG